MKVFHKYLVSLLFSICWGYFSIILAQTWIDDLSKIIGSPLAIFIIYGIAIVPGFMNAFIIASIILDKRPKRLPLKKQKYPPITIIIAAYNEGNNIKDTIESMAEQKYPGGKRVIVANDGSTDNTVAQVEKLTKKYKWLQLLSLEKNMGKSHALNKALQTVKTDLTITVDGDSYLHQNALKNITQRYLSDPEQTAAVAGSIMLRNNSVNLVTRTQACDYYIGIAATKRFQSFYHGTLVAQGAFSLYNTSIIRSVGGWPHCVGQDIVLTWAILKKGFRVGHAEDAVLFTNAPESWSQFIKQRKRWSRGLVQAFKQHWQLLFHLRLTTLFIWWNLIFPYLDFAYTLGFLPGVILALLFRIYWIAGPLTLLLLPIAVLMNLGMFMEQRKVIRSQKIRFEKDIPGFIFYIFFYSAILQPSCVYGYFQEVFRGSIKNWGTK